MGADTYAEYSAPQPGLRLHYNRFRASRVLKRRSTNQDLGAVTVSIGLAERLPGERMASLIGRADAALYASKRAGRNRTSAAATKISAAA